MDRAEYEQFYRGGTRLSILMASSPSLAARRVAAVAFTPKARHNALTA
jgi:hypothetical protein